MQAEEAALKEKLATDFGEASVPDRTTGGAADGTTGEGAAAAADDSETGGKKKRARTDFDDGAAPSDQVEEGEAPRGPEGAAPGAAH